MYVLMCANVLVVIVADHHRHRVLFIVPKAIVKTTHALQSVGIIVYMVVVVLVVEEMKLLTTLVIVLDFVHLLLVRPQAEDKK